MEDCTCVHFGRYSRAHLVTVGSDSARETLCGRSADGAIVSGRDVSCSRCISERIRRAQKKR